MGLSHPFDKPSQKVLIPLYRHVPLPVAHASLWITELRVYNASDRCSGGRTLVVIHVSSAFRNVLVDSAGSAVLSFKTNAVTATAK